MFSLSTTYAKSSITRSDLTELGQHVHAYHPITWLRSKKSPQSAAYPSAQLIDSFDLLAHLVIIYVVFHFLQLVASA